MSGPPEDSADALALSRHADLKHRPRGDVLVLPEQAIRLSGSGGEILALVDGRRDADAIAGVLRARYPDADGLEAEVARFLDEMIELGGVEPVGAD